MDLTTPAFVQAVVTDLTPAQVAALPGMVSTASALIQNWCNRQIGFQAGIDELVDAEESGQILIRETPIVNVERVASNPTGALYVTNFSGTTQRARVQIPSIDPAGLIGNSIVLETKSLGVAQTQTVAFATAGLNTVADLAAYIGALPGSWLATAEGDFASWGLEDLVAGQGWQGARQQQAQFNVYGTEPDYSVDRRSGIVTLNWSDWNDPFRSARFGPGFMMDVIDGRIGEQLQGIRVTYDAGYQVIPADLQNAVAELVKATFERMDVSSVLQSERTDVWAWTAREFGEVIGGMPESVRQVVNFYRNHA